MQCRLMRIVGPVAAVLLVGCIHRTSSPTTGVARGGVADSSGTFIFTAEELHRGHRSLIDLLGYRIPNMQVFRTDGCPRVYLRGRSTITTDSSPGIYVDGSEAVNTCILESLSTVDLGRVEVYPFGVTSRPGYRSNPYGLILIFSQARE